MNYRAEFKKTFIKDFNEIVESLPEKAAEKFGPKFASKIRQIINFPESCPRLHEPHYDESGIRWVPIIEKYILIYDVVDLVRF